MCIRDRVGPGTHRDYLDCHAQLGTGNSKLGKPLTVGLAMHREIECVAPDFPGSLSVV